jgi:hypothetical protein
MACSGGTAVSMSQNATRGCVQHARRARQVMDEGRVELGLVQDQCSNLLFRWMRDGEINGYPTQEGACGACEVH